MTKPGDTTMAKWEKSEIWPDDTGVQRVQISFSTLNCSAFATLLHLNWLNMTRVHGQGRQIQTRKGTQGVIRLGVAVIIVVVIYILWFYFHGKCITNTNHNHPLSTPPTSLFSVVNHP